MEKVVNEIQELLGTLKGNIAELVPSFEETVEQEAEKLASKQRKEIQKKFKIEQNDADNECKRIKRETGEIITDISRLARREANDIRRKHKVKLKAIAHRGKVENTEQLENISKESKSHTVTELISFSESQAIEMSRNSDLVTPPSLNCATCRKEAVSLYFCAACKITRYCDEMCQTKDWEKHRDTCVGLYHK